MQTRSPLLSFAAPEQYERTVVMCEREADAHHVVSRIRPHTAHSVVPFHARTRTKKLWECPTLLIVDQYVLSRRLASFMPALHEGLMHDQRLSVMALCNPIRVHPLELLCLSGIFPLHLMSIATPLLPSHAADMRYAAA